MPSVQHEQKIKDICEQGGFITKGFSAFASLLAARGCAFCDDEGDPGFDALSWAESAWSELRDSGGSQFSQQRLRIKCESEFSGISFSSDLLDSVGQDESPSLNHFISLVRENFLVVPDAWRYRDGEIHIVEVSDTSKIGWKKLSKLAMLDDTLFMGCGIRLMVCDIALSTGHEAFHSLNRVYELEYDDGWEISYDIAPKSEAAKGRIYHKEISESPSDGYYAGEFSISA